MSALRSPAARFGLIVAAVLLIALLAFGFRGERVPVDSAVAAQRELIESLREEGRTRIVHRYRVSTPVAGQTERIELRPGDQVEAGQVVARIAPSAGALWDAGNRDRLQGEARAAASAVQQAEQRLQATASADRLARNELARIAPLVQSGTLSKVDGDRADAAAQQSRADHAAARYALELARAQQQAANALLDQQGRDSTGGLEVRAPVAGVVLARLRESAGPVAVGEALLEIGDPASLEIEVDLLSADAVRVTAGMPVRLHRWGGDSALDAKVRRVEPVGFTKISALGVEEQRVWVLSDFVSAPDTWQRLGDGYRVDAEFILSAGPALVVPGGALYRRGEDWALYVIDADRAVERRVRVGRRSGLDAEILEGVQAGETVIVHPDDRVSVGTRVQTLP